MTTQPLTDAALRQALAELADGPEAGRLVADVVDLVEGRRQVLRLGWPVVLDRRWVLVGLAALLALGAVVAGMRPSDQPFPGVRGPFLPVLQRWNGLVDPDSVVELTAIDPASGATLPVRGAPRNATNLHWTLDGTRVAFLAGVAEVSDRGLGGPHPQLLATGLSIANGDWTGPLEVSLPAPLEDYQVGPLADSLAWAPTGDRFAVGWSNGNCIGDPDSCVVGGNIDIFDRTGSLFRTISIRAGGYPFPVWSKDGHDLGWYTVVCVDGRCDSDAFHWQPVDGSGAETVIAIPGIGGVTWLADGRLMAYTGNGSIIDRMFSMLPDGSDVRDVPGFSVSDYGVVSPDGTALASTIRGSRALRIDDMTTGHRIDLDLPDQLDFAGWSPDGQWILLLASDPEDVNIRQFYVVRADGTGFRRLGVGNNFAWAPASVLSGN